MNVTQKIQELNKRLNHFKHLYDGLPLAYQSLDKNAKVIEINPAWEEKLGYKRSEVIGKKISKFLSKSKDNNLKHKFSDFLRTGITQSEFTFVRKDGEEVAFDVMGRISYDEEGNFLQTHCILTPIFELKKLNAQLLKKNQDLEKFNKLAIDRELKMVELKRVITALRERILELEKMK